MNCLHKKIGASGGHTFTACVCTGSACTGAKRSKGQYLILSPAYGCTVIKSDIVVYINMHGNINSNICACDG